MISKNQQREANILPPEIKIKSFLNSRHFVTSVWVHLRGLAPGFDRNAVLKKRRNGGGNRQTPYSNRRPLAHTAMSVPTELIGPM